MGPQRVGHDLVTEKQPKCRKGVMRRTLSLLQTFTIWDITQDLSLTKRRWQKVNLWKLVFLKELTNSSNIGIANIGVGDSETERWWTGSIGKDYRNGLLPWMPIVIVPCICVMFNLQSALISLIPRMWEYDRDVKKIALDSKTPSLPFTIGIILNLHLTTYTCFLICKMGITS